MQQRSEFFPVPSAHEDYVRNRIPRGAHYDSADDGPEVNVIKALRPIASNVGESMRQVADVYLTVGAGYLLLANYQ